MHGLPHSFPTRLSCVLGWGLPRRPGEGCGGTHLHRGGGGRGLMLEMRPDCERCGTDLPAAAGGAFICSFECTFCAACSEALDDVCPNCGGELLDRPVRPSHLLGKNPASTERKYKG